MVLSAHFWQVLQLILARVTHQPLNWALTGSTSFALQGIPVTPADIDVQTDRSSAYQFEQLFAEYVQNPVSFSAAPTIKSHLGSLLVDGIKVEIIGNVQKKVNGVWTPPPNLAEHRRMITVRGFQIPVMDLAYEIESYGQMGREETVDLLRPYQQSTVNNQQSTINSQQSTNN